MDYYRTIINAGAYSSVRKLKFKMQFLFGDIDFKDKTVLDIGGGIGLVSFYAASMGARKVICLEPECDGSSNGLKTQFESIKNKLQLQNVSFIPETLQEFEADEPFDIVISHNSINHLNESACCRLTHDKDAKNEYGAIFLKLSRIMSEGARLIVSDCSNQNFFNLIRLKNPFVPDIEWHKHQSPQLWMRLFEAAGFTPLRLKWSSFNRLGKFGSLLFSHRLASYFLTSHFCLYLKKELST